MLGEGREVGVANVTDVDGRKLGGKGIIVGCTDGSVVGQGRRTTHGTNYE